MIQLVKNVNLKNDRKFAQAEFSAIVRGSNDNIL